MATVLVIDDSEIVLTIATALLQRIGHTVITTDGLRAIEMLSIDFINIDLVICDIEMPSIDGIQVYNWMCRERPDLVKTFIFHTADPDLLRNTECAAVPFMNKPGERGEFLKCVRKFVRDNKELTQSETMSA